MTKLKAVAIVAAILFLTGCSQSTSGSIEEPTDKDETLEYHFVFKQEVEDGNSVTCVWVKDGYAGGLSCDWVGYHSE